MRWRVAKKVLLYPRYPYPHRKETQERAWLKHCHRVFLVRARNLQDPEQVKKARLLELYPNHHTDRIIEETIKAVLRFAKDESKDPEG